jgi:hypothetical protein
MRPLLAFLLLATLVFGATFWRSWSNDPATTHVADAKAAIAPSLPAARIATQPALPPAPPLNPAETRARMHVQKAQRKAHIDRITTAGRKKIVGRYESEPIDSIWANATRQELVKYALSDQIRATHSEPSNLNIDCRRTTCRIVADFPNATAADDWSTLYLTSAGSRLPNASLQKSGNADGSVHLEIYALAGS